jgi:hypothetical protein
VYRREAAGAGPVDLSTSVRDAGGRVLFRSQDQAGGDTLKGGEAGFGYTVQVPLTGISPGAYTLRVEARSRRPADPPALRDVPFTVVR